MGGGGDAVYGLSFLLSSSSCRGLLLGDSSVRIKITQR